MSKKANSSIYHFENYIQIQKLKCLLKLGFNRAEKIKTIHAIETKWGIKIYCRPGYSLCSDREGKRITGVTGAGMTGTKFDIGFEKKKEKKTPP